MAMNVKAKVLKQGSNSNGSDRRFFNGV